MADWARSLQSGFQTGIQLGGAVRKRRLEDALAEEAAKYAPTEVISGEETLRGFREGTAQTDSFKMPDGNEITPAQYEQQYLGGLQQRPASYAVGGQDYASLAAAEQGAAGSRAAGLANVYRQFGEVSEAEKMMGLSRGAQLQNLQIGAAQRAEEDTLKVQAATNALSAKAAELGRTPTLEEVRQIASANKLSLDQQFKLGENITGIAEQDAKAVKLDIQKKIKGKGLDALLKLHKDDSLFDDNSFFEKSVSKDGKITLTQKTNDGAVIGTQSFPNAEAATKYLNEAAVAPENLFTWLQTNRLNEAKLAESETGIDKSKAQTALAEAQMRGLPAAAQTEAQRQNILLADQFRKQVADANKLLENYAEGTPQHNDVLAQRNAAARSLTDVNRLLQPGGLTRGGAQPGAPVVDEVGLEAARAIARSGINPETNKPFTAKDKRDFETVFGEKFPDPESEKPTGLSPRGVLGRLTPQSVLELAANQGNESAIAELRRREALNAARQVSTPGYNANAGFIN